MQISTASIAEKIVHGFPALGHKNFLYFWLGQCVSQIGTWSQRTAQLWLVYSLTQSPMLLGFLGVAQFAPTMFFSLVAGVLIDRYPKKQILLATQTIMMAQAMLLAILVWSGDIRYWQIIFLATVLGCVDTFDVPARQSFFIEMVGTEDLTGAISLNSASVNMARIVGPGIAGLLMLYGGAAFCFFFNSLSFIAMIIGLRAVQPLHTIHRELQGKMLGEIWEGLRYISSNRILASAILAMLAVGTFAMNTNVLVPILAKDILQQQAGGYSLLLSAMGCGALLSALLVSYKSKYKLQPRMIYISGFSLCLIMMAIYNVKIYIIALLLLLFFGFCCMIFLNTINSTLQLNSNNHFRGRTMSVYSLAFFGTTPIGNLYAGVVTEKFGPRAGFLACGGLAAVLLLVLWLKDNRSGDG